MKNLVVKGMVIIAVVIMAVVGVTAIGNINSERELKEVNQMVNDFNDLHADDILKASYDYDFDTDNYVISVRSYDKNGEVYGNGNHYNNVDEFVKAEF